MLFKKKKKNLTRVWSSLSLVEPQVPPSLGLVRRVLFFLFHKIMADDVIDSMEKMKLT